MMMNVQPDLLVVDWQMPRMNGYEFVKELKQKGALKEITTMVLTVENSKSAVMKMLKLGINDYMVKPINRKEFKLRLADLCSVHCDRQWNKVFKEWNDMNSKYEVNR